MNSNRYLAIAEAGQAIVDILRQKMVPDIVATDEAIGLCNPEEKGDIQLGIYLYDVRESDTYRDSMRRIHSDERQRYPSIFLSLSYMITAYSIGEYKYRAYEEQKLLGKVIEIFNDYGSLDPKSFEPTETVGSENLTMEMLSMTYDEKSKIWAFPQKPYKLSLFYRLEPLEIVSERERVIHRVEDIKWHIEQQERRR